MPDLYGVEDYLAPIPRNEIESAEEECVFLNTQLPCDRDVHELCKILLTEDGLSLPSDPYDIVDVYIHLREKILSSI